MNGGTHRLLRHTCMSLTPFGTHAHRASREKKQIDKVLLAQRAEAELQMRAAASLSEGPGDTASARAMDTSVDDRADDGCTWYVALGRHVHVAAPRVVSGFPVGGAHGTDCTRTCRWGLCVFRGFGEDAPEESSSEEEEQTEATHSRRSAVRQRGGWAAGPLGGDMGRPQ